DNDLASISIAPEVEYVQLRSTDDADLYGVRITSIGPYRLFAYLSIPRGEGPFPAIYYVPKNGSVHEVIPQGTAIGIRSRYVTFSIAGRGMRGSDKPYTAMYPGQLTDGLESADTYVYRGIIADAIRGLEYLMTRPEVDSTRIVTWGNDIAVMVAARRSEITHVVSTPAYLFDTVEHALKTSSYPLAEYSDYLRLYPDRKNEVISILSMYNLRWHAPAVRAETLLRADHSNGIYSPEVLAGLENGIAGDVTVHESERSSFKDGLFAEKWITEKFFGPDVKAIVPEHWRSTL
ncbi:MAG: acetylxylan esterase, partial [Dehalococcoidia bacterium]|nr:acetylxylan esterase [Dehalococcoidia bacterium]